MTEQPDPVVGDAPPRANTLLSNTAYDRLKQIAQIWLPALATFYIAIAPLWGLPKQEEVAGTLMALDLLLGAGLVLSKKRYRKKVAATNTAPTDYDGVVTVRPDPQTGNDNLNFALNPDRIADKDELVIKVDKVS